MYKKLRKGINRTTEEVNHNSYSQSLKNILPRRTKYNSRDRKINPKRHEAQI